MYHVISHPDLREATLIIYFILCYSFVSSIYCLELDRSVSLIICITIIYFRSLENYMSTFLRIPDETEETYFVNIR